MTKLFVFTEQTLVDVLKLANMLLQVTYHAIGTLKLLNQTQVIHLCLHSLPSHEGSPHSLQVVVLEEGYSKFLTSDEVAE